MPSIFADEWRECLIAHYAYVIRLNDERTERTLRGVMHDAGFSDDDLRQIYVSVTAHVDDMPADFVPDMEIFEDAAPVMVAVTMPEAVEESREAAVEVEELLPEEAVMQAAAAEAPAEEPAEDEAGDESTDETEEPPPADPDITQLSLF
jgi:hypothetical protein